MGGWALAVLDLVFPALCPVCAVPLGMGRRDPLCGACWLGIARIAPPVCLACGLPRPAAAGDPAAPADPSGRARCAACPVAPPAFDYARSAALYAGPLREALHALKFRGKRALARPLAELVLEGARAALASDVDALVPVPLAAARLRARGFNQAELIAERVGRALAIPVRGRWLARIRETSPQSDLGPAQRHANVRGAFAAARGAAGRHVVLIDDILTTGATAGECARALRGAGARRIGVVTVARVLGA
jgi:ComF family protein